MKDERAKAKSKVASSARKLLFCHIIVYIIYNDFFLFEEEMFGFQDI